MIFRRPKVCDIVPEGEPCVWADVENARKWRTCEEQSHTACPTIFAGSGARCVGRLFIEQTALLQIKERISCVRPDQSFQLVQVPDPEIIIFSSAKIRIPQTEMKTRVGRANDIHYIGNGFTIQVYSNFRFPGNDGPGW